MVISAIASQKQAMLTPTRKTIIKMRFTRCSRVSVRRAAAGQIGASGAVSDSDNPAFEPWTPRYRPRADPIGFSSSMRVACNFLKAAGCSPGGVVVPVVI